MYPLSASEDKSKGTTMRLQRFWQQRISEQRGKCSGDDVDSHGWQEAGGVPVAVWFLIISSIYTFTYDFINNRGSSQGFHPFFLSINGLILITSPFPHHENME